MKKVIPILATVLILVAGCERKPNNPGLSFDSTVSKHLGAIAASNLEELDPTVGDSVIMISPLGEITKTKTEFMELHRNWFAQTNWEWTPTMIRKENTDSMGYVLLKYTYAEKDSSGARLFAHDSYLVLIFKNSHKGWKLVHDQNTSIPPPQ